MKTAITILITLAIGTSLAIGPGAARAEDGPAAQGQTQQVPPQSTTTSSAKQAAMTKDEKMVISKLCSEQANQNGLHGKERQKFRNTCKRNGGQVVSKSAPKAS